MAAFALVAVAGMSVLSSSSGLAGLWFYTNKGSSASSSSPSSSSPGGSSSSSSSSSPPLTSAPSSGTSASKSCDQAGCDAAIKSFLEADTDFSTSTVNACTGCPARSFKYNGDQTARVLSKDGCPDLVTPGSIPESERQQLWKDYLSVSNALCSSPASSAGTTFAPSLTKTGCAAAIEKKMRDGMDSTCDSCKGSCWQDFSSLPECIGCGGVGENAFGMCYGGDDTPAYFKKQNKTYGITVSDNTKHFSTKNEKDVTGWSKWFMDNSYPETCSAATNPVASAQSGKTRSSTRTTTKTTAPKKR
jgi:hypothetical protein